jgi:ribosomal protein S18 acetylase RimI-like enzyme
VTTSPSSVGPADLAVRPVTERELELFFTLPLDVDDGAYRAPTTLEGFTAEWRRGVRRPEWTWLALRGGRPAARAAWWVPPGQAHPAVLDIFDLGGEPDRLAVGETLLRACWQAAAAAAGGDHDLEYELFLPPDWQDQPGVRQATEARLEAARRAGLVVLVERLRYQWKPASPVPAVGDRLRVRTLAEVGEAAFLDAYGRTLHGSLDAHTRLQVARVGVEQAARDDLAMLRQFPSPAGWWRLADDVDGQLVGLSIPARNSAGPIIGYVGVVPEQRGRGYAGDLLAEATRFLAAQGAERIRADTDLGNAPMAATFERAGYQRFATRIDLVAAG